jgi:hypothetical protein
LPPLFAAGVYRYASIEAAGADRERALERMRRPHAAASGGPRRGRAVSASGWIWFAVAAAAARARRLRLAAAVSWRGERLFPAPGQPLGRVPVVVAALGVAGASWFLAWVRDSEFSRYLGTGALMIAAIVLLALLLRQHAREG